MSTTNTELPYPLVTSTMFQDDCQQLNLPDYIIKGSCTASQSGMNDSWRQLHCTNIDTLEGCSCVRICPTASTQSLTRGTLFLKCENSTSTVTCSIMGNQSISKETIRNRCFYCTYESSCEDNSESLKSINTPIVALCVTVSVVAILIIFLVIKHWKTRKVSHGVMDGWGYEHHGNASTANLKPSIYNKFLYRSQSTSFITVVRINNSCTDITPGLGRTDSLRKSSKHDRLTDLRPSLSVR